MLYSLLSFLFTLFVLVQAYSFQTFLGRKLGAYLSKELKTEVRVGRVGIDFFQKAELKEVLILDLHNDTLLYSSKITCDLSKFIYPFNRLQLDKIQIENATAKIITYKNEKDFNFQFLIDYFQTDTSKQAKSSDFELLFGDLVLKKVDFSYINQNDTSVVGEGINYSDLRLNDASVVIQGFKIDADTISASVKEFSVKEKSGFCVQSFSGKIHVSPNLIRAKEMQLSTAHSEITGVFSMKTNSYDDYNDFLQKVKFDVVLNDKTNFNPADLSYFVPDLQGLNQDIKISGKVKGTVSSIKGKDMRIHYRNNTVFAGDLSIDGLPIIDETFLHVDIDTLKTINNDLVNIPVPPFKEKRKLKIPEDNSMST